MKNREEYLIKLLHYKDKPLIKVITGIRRCGKSTLLQLFKKKLLDSGVPKNHIIFMNFESFAFDHITTPGALHSYLQKKLTQSNYTHYLLLDEIQMVPSWEKVINSLLVDARVDIYITGSNAYLLSSELATLLSGRYVEIKMLPLSFKEYLNFTKPSSLQNVQQSFQQYMEYGSFPTVVDLLTHPETIGPFLEGIFHTVLVKDVIHRNEIRDSALLENLLKFIASNIGSIVSTKKISDYLISNGRKTTPDTIDNYLQMLEKAFIIYKAPRYDLKGKLFLKTLEKYYLVDIGIRNQLCGLRNVDIGHLLENIVFLELLRRGYEVSIGKIGPLEVDFVARKAKDIHYFQVSATILDENTRNRELKPLQEINDNYSKTILTLDQTPFIDYAGIKVVHLIDFLRE